MIRRRVNALAFVLAFLVACGPSAEMRVINTTYKALNSASAGFVAFDKQHQLDILANAGNRATAEAQLSAWRVEQGKVALLFAGAYRAVAAALMVQQQPNIDGMVQAALLVAQELQTLGVKL